MECENASRAGWSARREPPGGGERSVPALGGRREIYLCCYPGSLPREGEAPVGAPRVGGNHCLPSCALLPALPALATDCWRLFFVCWNPDRWGSSLTLATDACVCVCVCARWFRGRGGSAACRPDACPDRASPLGGEGGHAWVRRSFPRTRRAAAVEGEPVEPRPAGPGTGTVWLVRGWWSFLPVGWTLWRGPSSEPWGPRERKVWKGEIT